MYKDNFILKKKQRNWKKLEWKGIEKLKTKQRSKEKKGGQRDRKREERRRRRRRSCMVVLIRDVYMVTLNTTRENFHWCFPLSLSLTNLLFSVLFTNLHPDTVVALIQIFCTLSIIHTVWTTTEHLLIDFSDVFLSPFSFFNLINKEFEKLQKASQCQHNYSNFSSGTL